MATIANNGADIDTDDLKAKNVNVSSISNSFSATSKVFKDYPTLLYDGPFADAVLNRESQLLKTPSTQAVKTQEKLRQGHSAVTSAKQSIRAKMQAICRATPSPTLKKRQE